MNYSLKRKTFPSLLPAPLPSLSVYGCTLMRSLPDIPGHAMRETPPVGIDGDGRIRWRSIVKTYKERNPSKVILKNLD